MRWTGSIRETSGCKAQGASPVGIPFPELYNALSQRVIEAQDNPLYTSILIKCNEVPSM